MAGRTVITNPFYFRTKDPNCRGKWFSNRALLDPKGSVSLGRGVSQVGHWVPIPISTEQLCCD